MCNGRLAADRAVRDANLQADGNQQLTIFFSAGNLGPTPATVTSPGNAKNVITVGAMTLLGIKLSPATVMIAAVALGIVVDDTVHMMTAIERRLRRTGRKPANCRHRHRRGSAAGSRTPRPTAGPDRSS